MPSPSIFTPPDIFSVTFPTTFHPFTAFAVTPALLLAPFRLFIRMAFLPLAYRRVYDRVVESRSAQLLFAAGHSVELHMANKNGRTSGVVMARGVDMTATRGS